MDWTRPLAPIVHGAEGVVLDRLCRVSAPQTAGQLRRRADDRLSLTGVRKALGRLVAQGLVLEHRLGSAVGYQINVEHLAYPAVRAMVDAYVPYPLLRDRLRALVEARFPDAPPAVALYGSVVRAQAQVDSDIDILVVVPDRWPHAPGDAQDLVAELYAAVSRWTGNAPQVVLSTTADLTRARRAGDPFVASLAREADTVVGPSVRELAAKEMTA
jgi:predicted nucleotidyltransferase